MIYTLINPHDTYTFEASSDRVAALVSLGLGRGGYGCTNSEGEVTWPVMVLSSGREVEDAFKEQFGVTMAQAFKYDWTMLPAAFRSLWLVGIDEREKLAADLGALSLESDRRAFMDLYEDKHRSSMTNVSNRARALADHVEQNEYEGGDA